MHGLPAEEVPVSNTKDPDWVGVILGVGVLIFAFYVYFLPAFVAKNRRHHNAGPIAIVNVFFGWTLLGWVIALAWAFSSPPPKTPRLEGSDEERHDAGWQEREHGSRPILMPPMHLPDYLFDKKRDE